MGKKDLSEEDIKARYITPAVESAGWDKKQIRYEYAFTAGRIILRGNITARGKRKRADYLLFYKPNFPLAIIEAKDNNHPVGAGLQQAIEYAETLDIKYVYASNGDGFVEQNLITGEVRNLTLEEFPSPAELYQRYLKDMNITETGEKALLEPYFYVPGYKTPRYYQRIAINRTVDAVASGKDRILLVCATGTGKTFMAFQIIYRLWQAGIKKKILFLADRNALVEQTISGDFKPFGGKMTKVENKKLDSSYEIYLALYQQLAGEDGEEPFKQFKPEFFDLIIIDECHRGSAKEESAWRKILDYFSGATQIGCTATPVETTEASSQGKLVEQRPEEGTADELYEQIVAEKARLIKEGKIKKEKPLEEITEDEIPFEIPASWKWVRLNDLCEKIGSGSTPSGGRNVYKESGIKFLRSQNVYNDGLRYEGIAYISEEQNKLGSIVKAKDLLLNITGGSIERCAIVPDDFDMANINQHVMIIRNVELELRFWLYAVIISAYVQNKIMDVQVGVSREGLSAEKLKNFMILLPPLAEQKRIVAKLEQMLPYCDQLIK